jgi:hypothetical protein
MRSADVTVIDVELEDTFLPDDLFKAKQEWLKCHTEKPGAKNVALMETFTRGDREDSVRVSEEPSIGILTIDAGKERKNEREIFLDLG